MSAVHTHHHSRSIKAESPAKSGRVTSATGSDSLQRHTPDGKLIVGDRASGPERVISKSPRLVSPYDVLWAMLNTVLGKDKLAKFGQFTLRLVLLYVGDLETALSTDKINAKTLNGSYSKSSEKLALLGKFLRHPRTMIRIVVLLACNIIQAKLAGLGQGLGAFRHFLRFGKSPFKMRDLVLKVCACVVIKGRSDSLVEVDYATLMNRKTLGEIFGLYYNISDETSLLYRVGLLLNPTVRKLASRHEALAWYYDTWLGLYNACEKYSNLQKQEVELEIQIQVKGKSRMFSRQLLSSSQSLDVRWCSPEDELRRKEIRFAMTNTRLDILKNISDIVFNLYTVFHLKLPFRTLQIWMGISASFFSSVKIYRETKLKLSMA